MAVTRLAGGALWAATEDGAFVRIPPGAFDGPVSTGSVSFAHR
jgi:hypothetical protein